MNETVLPLGLVKMPGEPETGGSGPKVTMELSAKGSDAKPAITKTPTSDRPGHDDGRRGRPPGPRAGPAPGPRANPPASAKPASKARDKAGDKPAKE